MASGNKQENDRLEREQKRLEINMNIDRLEGFPSNKSNARRLRTSSIQFSPPVAPLRSSLVPLEKLERVDRLEDD